MDELFGEITKILGAPGGSNTNHPFVAILNNIDKDEINKTMNNIQSSPWGELLKNVEKHIATNGDGAVKGPAVNSKPSPWGEFAVASKKNNTCHIPIDIRQMESYVAVYFEIAGVKKENIELEIDKDNILRVSVVKQPYGESSDIFLLRERYVGPISTSVKVPKCADTSSINATYEDGVLIVKFMKIIETPSTKKITIL
jgi:HSP20 family molecular chaperone IbpA